MPDSRKSLTSILCMSVLTAILITPTASVANAQTDPAASGGTSGDCVPTEAALSQIQAIQNDPTLTYDQELTQELALRKQLLKQVLSCAINDAQALQTDLNGITPPPDGNSSIPGLLAGKIIDALNFYNLESSQIADAGIRGTEMIAKETLSWRTANYLPIKEDVDDFALWADNQNLFDTASNRLAQTERVVDFIESAAPNDNLQNDLGAVRSLFANAAGQNDAARQSLAELQSPDDSLALIQQSLQSLADTYQKFSDLNAKIQTLLPTSSQ